MVWISQDLAIPGEIHTTPLEYYHPQSKSTQYQSQWTTIYMYMYAGSDFVTIVLKTYWPLREDWYDYDLYNFDLVRFTNFFHICNIQYIIIRYKNTLYNQYWVKNIVENWEISQGPVKSQTPCWNKDTLWLWSGWCAYFKWLFTFWIDQY